MQNRITQLLGIEYPIIQAGMIWCSGWRLAAAVSNAGGLGIIGAGSMYPDVLREHLQKCKAATDKPFGVNVPLLYPDIDKHMQIIIEEGVKIVITSAGSPKTWTQQLQSHGIKVIHVTASSVMAKKCEDAGVDAIVAEGFEAGGHNGREETTTLCLIPAVRDAVSIPVIAAGGIASGKAMLAVMALGADGVQIGTRFVCSEESSAHPHFKEKVSGLKEGDTILSMKKVVPVRLIKNEFYKQIQQAEDKGADASDLMTILGRARAKKGMFEGDMVEGELEIGQIAASIRDIKPAGDIVREIWAEFQAVKAQVSNL
jgi:enoyl-[acyl-carrier protein] reductase II